MSAIPIKRLFHKLRAAAMYREPISGWAQLGIVLLQLAIVLVYGVLVWRQMELHHAEQIRQLLQRLQHSG